MKDYPKKQGLYDPIFEKDACGIGMIVQIEGIKQHKIVTDALKILKKLTHRGGVSGEKISGDGAGILTQIPFEFFESINNDTKLIEGEYAVAQVFFSPEDKVCIESKKIFVELVNERNMNVVWEREVPVYMEVLGTISKNVCPNIYQIFIKHKENLDEKELNKELYIISKLALNKIRMSGIDPYFYICSISTRTICYKGMLTPEEIEPFYLDLQDERYKTAIALVHSRFSTNTFPSFERAHPMEYLIHNGEINTIKGNVNWVKAREHDLLKDMNMISPIISNEGSDSAMLDDYIKLLIFKGYSIEEAIKFVIPEPFENNENLSEKERAYYKYNSCLGEPWDGPAAVAFSDGIKAGAVLDRNGLRPARYSITSDNLLILSSEAGVLDDIEDKTIIKDKLRPGRMLLIDTNLKKIISDNELKTNLVNKYPYEKWIKNNMMKLHSIKTIGKVIKIDSVLKKMESNTNIEDQSYLKLLINSTFYKKGKDLPLLTKQRIFMYTSEDINLTIKEMIEKQDDPIASMGTDTPLAILSNRPQLLFNYFKQLFAQVTNPPIDAIREKIVTSTTMMIGKSGDLVYKSEDNVKLLHLDSPILSIEELEKIKKSSNKNIRSIVIPIYFEKNDLYNALENVFTACEIAINKGYNVLILSDINPTENLYPIPSLLAIASTHHYLIEKGLRMRASIILESGEAREIHHFSMLVGYGASAICPTIAYQTIEDMVKKNVINYEVEKACNIFKEVVVKGIVKIMSKMGISTIQSYHGAQIFEALGISMEVIDKYFKGTISRIEGLTLRDIETEVVKRYDMALNPTFEEGNLNTGGDYKWRKFGEYHLFNPENIYYLQQSVQTNDYEMFKKYSERVNVRNKELKNIRGLLEIVVANKPLPLYLIEDAKSIVRRFKTGAMSYGSLSQEAHETIAIAMNNIGARSNCGEGGELASRYLQKDKCSKIKQVASGRFGVNIGYLNSAEEIQIKMAQGAKPGEGGHLPGNKVYPWIAKSRYSVPGVELISPPPHHDIYSIEDLAQLIFDLKNANKEASICVKLVSESGVGVIGVGVAKGGANVIAISGYDGGTGAAARTSIRHAGLPFELGIAELHQSLLLNNLRNKVKIETDGKLLTGRDIIIAALLGAEEFSFATTPLIAMGCNMMRVCNLNTCPVGIATQDPNLRSCFKGKSEYIENLMMFLAQEVREYMAKIGVRTFNELVGHVELLRQKNQNINEKAKSVDLSSLLYQMKAADNATDRYFSSPNLFDFEQTLDYKTLLPLSNKSIKNKIKSNHYLAINSTNRTVGAILSSEIVRKHGEDGLEQDTIIFNFKGSAGQSFGAFLISGVSFILEGEANDYVGKALSGGKIIIHPKKYTNIDNIIIGNVAFYGAVNGEAFIAGVAGERFLVRNSGVDAVVEGVGDHALEYMTGGSCILLGKYGRNFGSGMSGGVCYLYNKNDDLLNNLPKNLKICTPSNEEYTLLKNKINLHKEYTNSPIASEILNNYEVEKLKFVKIVPHTYDDITRAIFEAQQQKAKDPQLEAFFKIMGRD